MRFMILLEANAGSEAALQPAAALCSDLVRYNDRLARAGVLLAGGRLYPASRGIRVRFSESRREVIAGPFPDNGEILTGFWLLQVRSMEEAIEWVRRIPNPSGDEHVIEIRQVLEPGDPVESARLNPVR